ncbi:MAG: cytochrome c3 family protein, partial [Bdellovibrionota bacterium]
RNDETYGLCFQCHSTDLLNKNLKNGDETGFRKDAQVRKNGFSKKTRIERTNLHWLHVVGGAGPSGNNGFNGMERSCAACHSAHGTDQPFMIKSSITIENIFAGTVETGDDGDPLSLDFSIDFKTQPDGGTCTTQCHGPSNRPKDYGRLPVSDGVK